MEHLFIECVKKHPCLWKMDMEENKMNDVKNEAWRNVIKETELSESGIKTVKEAKYLWKKLRDMHRQSVTRKLNKGKGSNRKWKHGDQMEFLLPYLKCLENQNATADSDKFQDDIETNVPDNDGGSTTSKQPRKMENVTIYVDEHSRETRSIERDSDIMSRNDNLSSLSSRPALESFFTSMCEMTSSLPEHIQIRVERKVFDIVMEAREENLLNQGP